MSIARSPLFQVQCLLALAVLLGGGGIVYGLRHMTIALAALLVLTTVLVPLLQALPFPPAISQILPWPSIVLGLAEASTGISLALLPPLLTQSRSAIALIGVGAAFGAARLVAGWRHQNHSAGTPVKCCLVARSDPGHDDRRSRRVGQRARSSDCRS